MSMELMVSLADLFLIIGTTVKVLARLGTIEKGIALIEYRTGELEKAKFLRKNYEGDF